MPPLKHLSTGSADVPLQEGKLRLYSMRFCPYAQRAHLVLNAKNIPHDVVYINLKTKPEWYTDRVKTGKVPAISVDGVDLYESLVIADFLDEKYPDRPLNVRGDPLRKALDRLLVERFSRITSVLYQIFKPSSQIEDDMMSKIFDEMDFYEQELAKRGTVYFGGDQPGMPDYMIWPWCERLEVLKILIGDQCKVPKDRFPRMLQWSKGMLEDPAVKATCISPENHVKFINSYKTGTPDYDNICV